MLPVLIHGHRGPLPPPTDALQALARDLRRDVVILSEDIGPRHNGRPARMTLACEFLASALVAMGLNVTRQVYDSHGIPTTNLVATPPGQDPTSPCIVIGAHYDSVPNCPAANDNGSGVAGVLAIARGWMSLRPRSLRRGVRFVLFANEEPPHFRTDTMGSLVYARACRAKDDNLLGMFCLETIGCYLHESGSQKWPEELPGIIRRLLPSTGDFILWAGNWASREFVRACGEIHRDRVKFPLLATAVPDALGEIGWSDHWSFNQCGFASVMITDTAPFRYKWYHRPEDTADRIDFLSMARVVEGVDTVVRAIVERD